MSDDKKMRELQEMADAEGIELTDEQLDSVAGGFIYHDEGDVTARRREAYYVVDDDENVVMRLDTLAKAEHWAKNLRTNTKLLTAEEFERIRRKH
jgi:hypothetical protein